jgi:type IV pilus assembly protein PilE
MNRRHAGFTLIELMVVVAVVAILAAFAYSSYTEQMRKSRRAEAKQTLSDYALREEKWRSNSATYTSTLSDINGVATLPSGFYTIALSTPSGTCTTTSGTVAVNSVNSFAITATAAGAQASDSKCATIVWTNTCGTVTKTSTPSGNTCW